MKIYAPNKQANGVYASVMFVDGVGETDNPRLLEWFRTHGYSLEKCEEVPQNTAKKCESNYIIELSNDIVEPQNDTVNFEAMTPNELRDWMKANGFGMQIKNIRNKEKLLEIIRG